MSGEIFNIYVEKLINSVTELTKASILQSAQLTFYERSNEGLNKRIQELEKQLEETLNKEQSIVESNTVNENTDNSNTFLQRVKNKKDDSQF
jgi:hypothetical protein